ncbi:Guanine nucleotide-binding protein G(o) subunit alpha [Lobulomyces angularis]|nr:Guanine nucleotide-binding protein G(o) subunit alpha [Lobulomyces angularis]
MIETDNKLELLDVEKKLTIKEARKRSNQIDEQIRKESNAKEKISKLLLLGPGDSGKSTFNKQMRILYGEKFTEAEKEHYKKSIYENIIKTIQDIITGLENTGFIFEDEKLKECAKLIKEFVLNDSISPKIVNSIITLWKENSIKDFHKSNSYLQETASFFLDSLEKIFDLKYTPTDQDIIYCRKPTSTITETTISISSHKFCIYDVGGQKSLRMYWVPYFEMEATAILFIASIASYDQTLVEDPTINRMRDAIKLFDYVCNNKLLKKTAMILFLNKADLFEEKIKCIDIKKYFPEFGDRQQNLKTSKIFFRKEFECLNKAKGKNIYVHFTTNTDSKLMRFMITAVTDIVVKIQLSESGMTTTF